MRVRRRAACAGKTGKVVWMKAPYGEGPATHTGPESCVAVRKGRREALTGVRTGWAIEPRNSGRSGAPTLSRSVEGHTGSLVNARGGRAPRGLPDPTHVRTHLAREPGDPRSDLEVPLVSLLYGIGRVRGVNPSGARRR